MAAYWKVPPSNYLPSLSGLQRYMLDEAAAHWLIENRQEQATEEDWVGENVL
ncbi:MAG: hypothetical protein ACLKAK_07320 [Alkaliphilus sp.]